MKAAELLVKVLENEGVEYIFGIPGEENLDLLEALRTSKIKFILESHEQGGGFMAATLGRLTGKPGVCLSTLGPGATNFVTAAAYATLGGMPMLMITGQKPIKSSKQGHFQIVSTCDIMAPVTKFTRQITNANQIPSQLREAFRIASEERPGAVHIELPEDIAAEEADTTHVFSVQKVRRPVAEEKAVLQAVKMIQAAKHPLLLVGAGANRKLSSKILRDFVDSTGIPFFDTQMGKGVIDERHPLYLGSAALSQNDFLHCAIDKADLIINVGHDVVEKPPFIMHEKDSRRVIHINFYGAKVDSIYFPELEVVGDIANALWQIKGLLQKEKLHFDIKYFLKIKHKIEAHIARDELKENFPSLPQRIVYDVRACLAEDAILTLDNGMYKLWFARNYKAYHPNTILLDNALATMGAGFPSAIAAKILNPEKKVVALCGDGGFMMNSQELETAVRLGLHLVVIILNDNGYGMIKWKQAGMGFKNFALEFGNPNFVKYAESYGAKGYRIKKTDDFAPLLKSCLNKKGVHVIEVPVDYRENLRVLTKELKEKSCDI